MKERNISVKLKKKKEEVRAQNSNFFPQNFFTSHPTR